MALDENGQPVFVPLAGGLQQVIVAPRVGAHGGVHIPLPGKAGQPFTALERILCSPAKITTRQPGALRGSVTTTDAPNRRLNPIDQVISPATRLSSPSFPTPSPDFLPPSSPSTFPRQFQLRDPHRF